MNSGVRQALESADQLTLQVFERGHHQDVLRMPRSPPPARGWPRMRSTYGRASVAGTRTSLPAHPSGGTTRADFYSGRYRISADVLTGKRRLLDALRKVGRLHIDVHDLEVSSHRATGQSVRFADGVLSKSEIDWAAVRAEPPRAEPGVFGFAKQGASSSDARGPWAAHRGLRVCGQRRYRPGALLLARSG